MKITSLRVNQSHLTANEEAILRCQTAFELKDRGRYDDALDVMKPLWGGLGKRPDTGRLYPAVAAEILLCAGILTRWIGSRNQLQQYQEIARDLISESISFYESDCDVKKIAAARSELAYCYWWEGSFDEARILFHESLRKLTVEGNTRATALLGLAVVEWASARYSEALALLTDNAFLFNKITNHATRGAYHSQVAMLLRSLATPETKRELFVRAITEYRSADHHFKLARNNVFRADVKNNLGYLLLKLGRLKEAHQYVAEARRLAGNLKDKVRVAQFDDTRAQAFIAGKKFKEAETVAKGAVRILEKSGHQCLLTDSLITHGIALARLKQHERAQFTFQKAIDVAHQVGALNKAGLAALALLEELDELSPEASYAAYERASDWLSKSQSPELLSRLNSAARKVFTKVCGKLDVGEATDSITNRPCHLQTEVLKFEGSLIRQALAQSNASVTKAALSLGMSYQGLAYVIASRHPDLLKERSPVRKRVRKEREVKEDDEVKPE
jgi:tetratricopeptide (TPR) repeat protein